MFKHRSFVSLLLVVLAVVLVSCGGPNPATIAPPTYTSVQLEKIQSYVPGILENHQRLEDVRASIQVGDWQEAQALMRGPLGQMLQDMRNLARNLLPQDQKRANQVARDFFDDLTSIDQAAQLNKPNDALTAYQDAVRDFEQFMQLVPTA